MFSLNFGRAPYQARYVYIGAWAALGLESFDWPVTRCGSTYASNEAGGNRHASREIFSYLLGGETPENIGNLVGAVGIELSFNLTKSHAFTVLPTANQMNGS